MGETVHVTRPEDKASAQLEGISPEFVLRMAGGLGAGSGFGIVASQQVEQVRAFEFHGGIGFAFFVNEQREGDACFLAKGACVEAITQPDCCQVRASIVEGLFVCAQLRDMLAAEDSTVMAQENYHGRLADP